MIPQAVVSDRPFDSLIRYEAVGEAFDRDYIDGAGSVPAEKGRYDLSSDHSPAARNKAALNPASGADAPQKLSIDELSPEERSGAILSLILSGLDDDKAEDVVTIDLGGKTDFADAMVVASGRSARHVGAMADKVVKRLKEAGMGRAKIEGAPACDWVLIDAEDVIVHLFRPEVRKFYNLERIWSETARAPVRTDN